MITVSISPWDDDSGLKHKSTTWQIATDEEFSDIIDHTDDDETNLDVWTSDLVLPLNTTWYARAKRKFDDGSESDWIGPTKLISVKNNINIEIKPDVKIKRPILNLIDNPDNDYITITVDPVEVKGQDVHFYTNWIIKNTGGKIIHYKIKDRVNVTEIKLDRKAYQTDNLSDLILEVSVGTSASVESELTRKVFNLKQDHFDVILPEEIKENEDLVIEVYPSELIRSTSRVRYKLYEKNEDDEYILVDYNYRSYFNVVISKEFFTKDKDYKLEISGYGSNYGEWTEPKVFEFTVK